MMKNLYLLSFGLIISFIDMSTPKSLKVNILKRFLGISTGLLAIFIIDRAYLNITLNSLLFLLLHLKTWNSKFVWFGSLLLGVICACSVYLFHSIWSAIIIHNLNDFAFLTLINKRNIFSKD